MSFNTNKELWRKYYLNDKMIKNAKKKNQNIFFTFSLKLFFEGFSHTHNINLFVTHPYGDQNNYRGLKFFFPLGGSNATSAM